MQWVRTLSKQFQPLSAQGARATVRNPDWFGPTGLPTLERRGLHDELVQRALLLPVPTAPSATTGSTTSPLTSSTDVDDARASDALSQSGSGSNDLGADARGAPRAVVMAGPPGAGKSTVRVALLWPDTSRWTVIDADAFKDGLIDAALTDGTYESWIKPPEVHALEARGERFFPAEMSALLQAESGLLAREQRLQAVAGGRDIVVDTVLWNARDALALGTTLERAGYAIDVVDVEVPYALSAARIAARWESVYREALAGRDERGGRWVPSEYARIVYGGPGGTRGPSLCESSARELAERCPAVASYRLFRAVPDPGADRAAALSTPAVLEAAMHRRRAGSPLRPTPAVAPTRSPAAAPSTAPPALPAVGLGPGLAVPIPGATPRAAQRPSGSPGAAKPGGGSGRARDGEATSPASPASPTPPAPSAQPWREREQADGEASGPSVWHACAEGTSLDPDEWLEP